MSLRALEESRFVRKTQLAPGEYRKNFHQIDREILTAVTSKEADAVTPLMSKIYLRLVNAPGRFWERVGVLRIEAELREEKVLKAWAVLCDLVGVSSATASKALRWMHEQGIIGYFAGKNGVGIRVFLNRASSSIGSRVSSKKILEFPPASAAEGCASRNEAAFRDSYADSEVLETDINPRAPKNGAESTRVVKALPPVQRLEPASLLPWSTGTTQEPFDPESTDKLVRVLLGRLEPAVHAAAAQAAAREHERTREWLESRGLPKAARVAQREAFNLLRRQGLIGTDERMRAGIEVGRRQSTPAEARQLSPAELGELAETCVAMLEVHGQAIDVTLAELDAEVGGVLRAEDAPKVRELALALASDGGKGESLVV
jgi:hypothetical protein